MLRRFFSALFSAALLVVVLPLAAEAQEGTTETTPPATDMAKAGVEATTSNVSAETGNGSSSSNTGSQQSSDVTVSQAQADEGTQSQAVTGDLNTARRSGIPNGTPAPGTNPDHPNSPPNLITIGVEDCTVSGGASITVEDGDGTEARFVDGSRAIEIIGTQDEVTIEGPPGDFIGDHAVSTSDPGFDTDGDYTVVRSTGITCKNEGGGGGNNNRHDHNRHDHNRHHHNRFHHNRHNNNNNAVHKQYESTVEETVIKETIPNKGQLAGTGGMPLAGVALLSLAIVGVGVSILRSAIRRGS
jgi:hypothetical protein